ncbi:MAG: hypothetical protein K8T91_18540 [Planctomycetes bacterium]|nr:hypothetical protein [Planctomycetota bacterium]
MKPHESIVLMPCHAWSDFPYHHEGEAAADLLACYTSLWHPLLLAGAGRMPMWHSAYNEEDDLSGKLVVLPRVCGQDLPGHWPESARQRGALLVEAGETVSRDALVENAAHLLGRRITPLPAGIVADFYSLGLCHLLVELLTVQMRYSSLIDEELFSRHLIAAADAALESDEDTAREKLAICFDALNQSRSHFYPVECYLLDLTLLAPTTIGKSLRHELARGVPLSLLVSGSVIEAMNRNEPASVAAVRESVANEMASLVGGEFSEAQGPLLPMERVLGNFHRGLEVYDSVLGARPRIFGRRRAGLTPQLPQILEKLNFAAALHFTLDDGKFPQARQSLTRWEGTGATAIDALTRVPLEAAKHESILAFPQYMSTAMDMDHVAIVAFAHWPGMTSMFYDDLRRSAAYGSVVGRFVTLDTLFNEAEVSGQITRFTADEYRTPYLAQQVAAGEADSVSGIQSQYLEQGAASAIDAIETLTAVLRQVPSENAGVPGASGGMPGASEAPPQTRWGGAPLAPGTRALLAPATRDFASALPCGSGPATPGYLVVNPLSFGRRIVVPTDKLESPPAETAPVSFARQVADRKEVCVDVPPMGYVWITGQPGATWKSPEGKPLAEGRILRNEFCEVTIHEKTGGVQSIMTDGHRGNRLSQQVALRRPGKRPEAGDAWQIPDETASYSSMVAESVEITHSGPAIGEIASRGRLLDEQGTPVAEFKQRTSIVRGTPVLWLDVEIQPLVELEADPWQHYFAARLAWSDESAALYRDVGLVAEATELRRIEAPHYVEIRSANVRTAILAGGLPYHRRVGTRQLDTILIVRDETKQHFRLGIGLDLTHPQTAALECLAPPTHAFLNAPPPKIPTAWLFHIDAKNVVATYWEPVVADGSVRGVRVRLLETAGRAVVCGFHSHRRISAARRLDFLGGSLGELQPDGDKVIIDMPPGAWVQLEVEWV